MITHKSYFRKLSILLLLLIIYSSCNTNSVSTPTDTSIIYPEVETTKKYRKNPNQKRKGIEEMAEYRKNILKPIDANNPTYKRGFLMVEHEKALKRSSNSKQKGASIIRWKERGPVNVPGRVRGITVAPDNPDKWYAGSVGGGLWRTVDAGKTWENLTDYKVPNLATSTIAISQTNSRKLYIGTGEPFRNLDAIGGIGLLKTTNEGRSWDYLSNTKNFGGIGRLALNPEDDNNLIVASSTGIYVTNDGGETWQQTYDKGNVQDINHDPTNFNVLYAGVAEIGVVKSIDGGVTWDLVLDKNDYNANNYRFELDVSPVNPNKVLISAFSFSGATTAVNTDFYVSGDAGASFTLLEFEGTPAQGNLITGQGWYDNVIMAHPFNENVFYTGGVIVNRVEIKKAGKKIKGKKLFYEAQPIAAGYNNELNDYVHVDQHGLAYITRFPEKKFKLLLANDGGIYHTDYLLDPGTTLNDWSTAAVGLNCTQFYGADKRNGVSDYMAGAQDNGTWISLTGNQANDETQYQFIIGGDGFEVIWNYDDANKFIGGSQFNNFVRYVNGQGFFARHGESGGGSPFYSKIANANNNPNTLFSPGVSGIWRSGNFAESWELTPIPDNYAVIRSNGGVSSSLDVEVSVANPDVVWAGNAIRESGEFVMHVSEDNGISFKPTSVFIDPRDGVTHDNTISGIGVSPTSKDRAYVLFSQQGAAKVLKTEDLGQTWEDISGFSLGEDRGFPDVAIHSLVEMPFDKDRIWVGTDIGVFQTLDGGKHWALLAGLPAFSVWQMKIVNDEVVLATHGRGVWSATLEELEGYEPPAYYAPPTVVSVDQESISNTNAVITYTQKNEDIVAIKIFLDGEEIDEITDNIAAGAEFTYLVEGVEEGNHSIGLQAIGSESTSIQSILKFDIVDYEDPSSLVAIQTFEPSDVYTYSGEFVIDNVNETVSQPVLNNRDHPYENGTQYQTVLKHPIIVSQEYKDFKYEDVAIVEFNPTPNQFYDVVVIDASTDLKEWKQLDIYDAERFPEWTTVYNLGDAAAINDDLFKEQSIDLLNFFEEGDEIVIRFRLISDPFVTSFGWAIRSINSSSASEDITEEDEQEEVIEEIAEEVVEVVKPEEVIKGPVLYPTLSNGEIHVSSHQPVTNSKIEIFGLNGRMVYQQGLGTLNNAQQTLVLNNLKSGMYLVKITGDKGFHKTSRIMIK